MDMSVDLFFNYREESTNVARLRKKIRDSSNPLELTDSQFISLFRINKDAFLYLLNEIKDFLQPILRGSEIPPILKLCCTLRFLTEGSYQKGSGNDFNVGFAQPTASIFLSEILDVIEEKICSKWIRVKMSEEEKSAAKRFFYSRSGLPGVIGCIDGTHVRIVAPKRDVQHLYLNRKGYYSLNVMIVWINYKGNLKRKLGNNRNNFEATGGGPSTEVSMTAMEQSVADLINVEKQIHPSGRFFGLTTSSSDVVKENNVLSGIENEAPQCSKKRQLTKNKKLEEERLDQLKLQANTQTAILKTLTNMDNTLYKNYKLNQKKK